MLETHKRKENLTNWSSFRVRSSPKTPGEVERSTGPERSLGDPETVEGLGKRSRHFDSALGDTSRSKY